MPCPVLSGAPSIEPVSSGPPKVSIESKSYTLQYASGIEVNLPCKAQAFLIPRFR